MRVVRGKTDSYIHVVYYDRITNAIKYSDVQDGKTFNNSTNYELPWIKIDGSSDDDDTSERTYTYYRNTYSLGYSYVLPESQFEDNLSVSSGTGETAAMALTSKNYPVIIYMDAESATLRLARANNNSPMAISNWKVQNILPVTDGNYSYVSDYIVVAIDEADYLHIAFQNTKGQLVYVKSDNNPSDGTVAYTFNSGSKILDDSGMWIDITMDGTTPYISYLSKINAYDGMKLAFYDSSLDEDNDGIADGGWETMTAPLNAKVTNVRSCIEVNAKAYDGNIYTTAIGFCPGSD